MTRYSVDVCLTVLFIPVDAENEHDARRKAIEYVRDTIFHASGEPAMWQVNYVSMKEEEE